MAESAWGAWGVTSVASRPGIHSRSLKRWPRVGSAVTCAVGFSLVFVKGFRARVLGFMRCRVGFLRARASNLWLGSGLGGCARTASTSYRVTLYVKGSISEIVLQSVCSVRLFLSVCPGSRRAAFVLVTPATHKDLPKSWPAGVLSLLPQGVSAKGPCDRWWGLALSHSLFSALGDGGAPTPSQRLSHR